MQDIDAALLRRFERKIEVGLLNECDRTTLLRLKMKGTPVSRNTDLSLIASHTEGYSGAVCLNASCVMHALMHARFHIDQLSQILLL